MDSVKTLKFEELYIGQNVSFDIDLTPEKHKLFTDLSGDINPLHIDAKYAQSQGFPDCVAYGMCTSAFYSTLVGVYLPGKYCLFLDSTVKWKHPAYIGDSLTIYGEIVSLDTRFHIAQIKASIKNQNKKTISTAKLTVKIMEEH